MASGTPERKQQPSPGLGIGYLSWWAWKGQKQAFRIASVLASYLRSHLHEGLTASAQMWPKAVQRNKKRNSCLPSPIPGNTIFSQHWVFFFFFLKKYKQTDQKRNKTYEQYFYAISKKKELSKLRIDRSRQKMGWITTQKMFSNSEAGLRLHKEDMCVSGWARVILEKPSFQNMNVTCTKPVLSSTTSPVLGLLGQGT